MNNIKISYLNSISPYSRHSPNLQLKTDLKKQSSSVERPKSSKVSYSGITSRGQTPVNNPESIDKKYCPFTDKKNELMASLYQIAKSKAKEKPSTAKVHKTRDVQPKKTPKTASKPSEKINEKLAIYQYLQNRSSRKSEESKIIHPSMQQTPSRQFSKLNIQEEKDQSYEKKMLEASILQQRQLMEALEDMNRSKSKGSGHTQNQSNLALLLKSAQRASQSSSGKALQYSSYQQHNTPSAGRSQEENRKALESKKSDLFKDLKLNMNFQDFLNQKDRVQAQPVQLSRNETATKKHRRGLSTGQNPISIDQFAAEQERIRQLQILQQQEQLQQMQQMQQMQQQQQQYMRDPQQEEDEFYEQFFHMDKMTFDFEKLMVTQKLAQPDFYTPSTSPINGKTTSHSRTKSIDEPISLMPTKSSSRWTTKRSSVGEDQQYGGRENFNLIEQISDLDRTDEREEFKRFYKR